MINIAVGDDQWVILIEYGIILVSHRPWSLALCLWWRHAVTAKGGCKCEV